jgi:hypothetical protein
MDKQEDGSFLTTKEDDGPSLATMIRQKHARMDVDPRGAIHLTGAASKVHRDTTDESKDAAPAIKHDTSEHVAKDATASLKRDTSEHATKEWVQKAVKDYLKQALSNVTLADINAVNTVTAPMVALTTRSSALQAPAAGVLPSPQAPPPVDANYLLDSEGGEHRIPKVVLHIVFISAGLLAGWVLWTFLLGKKVLRWRQMNIERQAQEQSQQFLRQSQAGIDEADASAGGTHPAARPQAAKAKSNAPSFQAGAPREAATPEPAVARTQQGQPATGASGVGQPVEREQSRRTNVRKSSLEAVNYLGASMPDDLTPGIPPTPSDDQRSRVGPEG